MTAFVLIGWPRGQKNKYQRKSSRNHNRNWHEPKQHITIFRLLGYEILVFVLFRSCLLVFEFSTRASGLDPHLFELSKLRRIGERMLRMRLLTPFIKKYNCNTHTQIGKETDGIRKSKKEMKEKKY